MPWEKLLFNTVKEAREFYHKLWRLIDDEEQVTLYDILTLAGMEANKVEDSKWYWYDLGAMYVEQVGKKYRVIIQNPPMYRHV